MTTRHDFYRSKEQPMDEKKLQGLCKDCMYRKRCEDAKRYLNMIGCSEHKVHGNRKKIANQGATKEVSK